MIRKAEGEWRKAMNDTRSFYETLDVYKLSISVSREIIKYCETQKLSFGIRDQLARSAGSISANIAEGYAYDSEKQRYHYICIALGSCFELKAWLHVISYDGNLFEDIGRITQMLSAIKRKHKERLAPSAVRPSKVILGVLLLMIFAFAGGYMPFPFVQGVYANDIEFANGSVYLDGVPVAWNVQYPVFSRDYKIIGFRFNGDAADTLFMADENVSVCDLNCANCVDRVLPHYSGILNRDYRAIALTVMWSMNAAYGGMAVANVDEYMDTRAVLHVRPPYDDTMVDNAIRMYGVFNPSFSMSHVGDEWTFIRKQKVCLYGA